MSESILGLSELDPILESASVASVAVGARRGPHVTPQVFAVFGGRVWMATPHSSVKARVLKQRPTIGLLLRGSAGLAILAGEAEVLDPAKPWSLLGAMTETAMSGPATAAYAIRNLEELRSLVIDALTLKLGPSALQRRVVVAVRPSAVTVFDDGVVVASQGWPEPDEAPLSSTGVDARPVVVSSLPDDVAELARTSGDAALGWMGPTGPLALPVHWDPNEASAVLHPALGWMLAGRSAGPASLTIDESDRRMSETLGVLLRGNGRVSESKSGPRVTLDVDRAAWWTGVESGSVSPLIPD